MYRSPEELYRSCYPDYQYGEELYTILKMYRLSWMQKSDVTVNFLASNYVGVYPVRFSQADEETLFDILGMDPEMLQNEIWELKGVSKNMRTATNVIYVTLTWFAHKFATSKLPQDIREDAIRECYYIISYRIIGRLTAHFHKFDTDIPTAKAVNENMTNKFLIKRYENWQKLVEYKSEDYLPHGPHWARMLRFTTDDLIRIISDVDTKYRDIFKNNYGVLVRVRKNNERVTNTSLITKDGEGKEKIQDVTNIHSYSLQRIKQALINKLDFLNLDLIELIARRVRVISSKDLEDALVYLTEVDITKLESYIEKILVCSYTYIATKGIYNNYEHRLMDIINLLLSYWKAGNIKSIDVKETKQVFYSIVEEKLVNAKTAIVLNVSIAAIVYIVIFGIV